MKLGKMIIGLFIMSIVATAANAEEEILPQKRLLIKDLLAVTDLKKRTEKTMEISFENLQNTTLPQMLNAAMKEYLDPETLDSIPQEKMESAIKGASARIVERVRKAVTEKMDIGQRAEDITFDLYNKHFTEDELQDILDFYRSPTGMKAVSLIPQMTADALKAESDAANKAILEAYIKVMKEEMANLVADLFSVEDGEEN